MSSAAVWRSVSATRRVSCAAARSYSYGYGGTGQAPSTSFACGQARQHGRGFASEDAAIDADEYDRRYLIRNYNANGVRTKEGLCFVSGDGCTLKDTEGKTYLDFMSGIAVNALGHSDAAWADAVADQASTLAHVSNLFHSEPPLRLAKRLVDHSRFDRTFFCNSGTEANEAALKFARRFALHQHQHQQGHSASTLCEPGYAVGEDVNWKNRIVAFKNGFHGRTMGALSLTHKPAIRKVRR